MNNYQYEQCFSYADMKDKQRVYNQNVELDIGIVVDILNEQDKKIAGLIRENRNLKKPQFTLIDADDDSSGDVFHCNHCRFATTNFANRDQHEIDCKQREEYLRGDSDGLC